jgi:methionine sulfoxide reductase heme-binding subunit
MARPEARWPRSLTYGTIWFACLLPLLLGGWWFYADQFTADPFKRTLQYTGEWGLRFLLIGLALTPLRLVTDWSWPARYRRTIGLYGFFYIVLHLLSYVVLDQTLDWAAIWVDLTKRPYIIIGMAAFLLLVSLAMTSTNGMIRRVGGRRWRQLHRLVYVVPPFGALHYFLLTKLDKSWPLFYGALAGVLLLTRIGRMATVLPGKRQGAAAAEPHH